MRPTNGQITPSRVRHKKKSFIHFIHQFCIFKKITLLLHVDHSVYSPSSAAAAATELPFDPLFGDEKEILIDGHVFFYPSKSSPHIQLIDRGNQVALDLFLVLASEDSNASGQQIVLIMSHPLMVSRNYVILFLFPQ